MNQELRFGIITLQNVPWEKQVERWQYIEALGFDTVWLADHFVNPYNPSEPWFEAWALLAALATQTTRIRIGTLVTSIPFRNPAFLARQALTVDHVSNGRLELGLGAGSPGSRDTSYSMTGTQDWAPPERVARFREVVEIVDQCLRNRVTTYQGHYYQLKDTAMYPPPVQQPRPPITIGAVGPAMLKYAARCADTWNSFSWGKTFEERLEETRRRNELVDKYCSEIGRDPGSLRRSYLMLDPEARRLGELISYYESEKIFRDMVRRYVDVGITEFILYYPFGEEQLPVFEKIAREVIPELRNLYSL